MKKKGVPSILEGTVCTQGRKVPPMWVMIDSLAPIVDQLKPVFTQPSFQTSAQLLLGWVMCLGKHTLRRVAHTTQPGAVPDHSQRHGLDGYYNYFERSAWTAGGLARRVAVLVFTRLKLFGVITLLVDDTLAHKRAQSVWGLGWFRDACASTKKRVATAPGHNWVVLAVAVCLPGTGVPILALPLCARLHRPGKGQPSCPELAQAMLAEVLDWFPRRRFSLVGGGAYALTELLRELGERGGLGRSDPWRRRRVRPACSQSQARPARPQGPEGAETAQAQGGGAEGRPQASGGGTVAVAGGRGGGVRLRPQPEGGRLRGVVAA